MISSVIKKELKESFPHIKFSVRTQSGALNIKWENGVSTEEVEKIVVKYKYGHFDPSDDCYKSDNCRDDITQTKYIFTNRTITDDMYIQAYEYIRHTTFDCFKDKELEESSMELNKELGSWTPRNFLYRHLSKMDLSNGLSKEELNKKIFCNQ